MTQEADEHELLQKTEASGNSRRRWIGVGVVPVVMGAYAVLGLVYGTWSPLEIWYRLTASSGSESTAFTPTFDGDSANLKNTQIVPTLDTPIEDGKNVIWCATFAAGWKQSEQKVTNGPVKIAGADDMCARLNAAPDPAPTIPAKAYYANAGLYEKGIIQTIRKDMGRKFPSHQLPEFQDPGAANAFMFYSYLTAHVPFTVDYFDSPMPLEFTGGDGVKTPVRSFGSNPSYGEYLDIRYQSKILMARWQETPDTSHGMLALKSFAVDLCQDSKPYQIVAARVTRKESLAATLDALEGEIQAFSDDPSMFENVLLVPNMVWRLAHHYREMEGQPFENPGLEGLVVVTARQDFQFRLDKSGARVESEALMATAGAASRDNRFLFNGPFLLYIKTRGAATPFFVMWVDNAELLQRWAA